MSFAARKRRVSALGPRLHKSLPWLLPLLLPACLVTFVIAFGFGFSGPRNLSVLWSCIWLGCVALTIGVNVTGIAEKRALRWLDPSIPRSLCPACLAVESFEVHCPHCDAQINPARVRTPSEFRSACPECRVALGGRGEGSTAFAVRCGSCQASIAPEACRRRLGVLGVLTPGDFERLAEAAAKLGLPLDGEPEAPRGMSFTWTARECHLCVLCLHNLRDVDRAASSRSAVQALDHVWIGAASLDPLSLSRGLDAYLRLTGIGRDHPGEVPVYLETPGIDPQVRQRLAECFSQIHLGSSAESFLRAPLPTIR